MTPYRAFPMLLALALTGPALAAEPPELLNHQGVLRDASDQPLDGTYDMLFRFYDAAGDASCNGGTVLLTDAHEAAGSGAVQVSGGLFNVALGAGTLTPGSEAGLNGVFRNHAAVFLQVEVGGETLCPRLRVQSSGYALNAAALSGLAAGNGAGEIPVSNGTRNADLNADMLDGYHGSSFGKKALGNTWTGANTFSNAGNSFTGDGSGLTGVTATNSDTLDGHHSSHFLDTSSAQQTKAGALTVNESGALVPAITTTASFYGIDAQGNSAGGYFREGSGTGYAYVGSGGFGVRAYGGSGGGTFSDRDNTSSANLAYGELGIEAEGSLAGGRFVDMNGTSDAYIAHGSYGVDAHGANAGGRFEGSTPSTYALVGHLTEGIYAQGTTNGGYFVYSGPDDSSIAELAAGGYGVDGYGTTMGGYFHTDLYGVAYLAYANTGVVGRGRFAGGDFVDSDGSGRAYVGYGDTGVDGKGNVAGGYFKDANGSGYAYVGYGEWGIRGEGNVTGGYFKDADHSGYAYVGYGDRGVYARGSHAGAYFDDINGTSWTQIAYAGDGISAHGDTQGGYFQDDNSSVSAHVAYDTYKIQGTGTVSFVQNHPEDPDRVIVYVAPEGDEVATYTRGTARLEGGEARVPLGKTFRWVTNPDIGLTAHLTPRGEAVPLAVVNLTTEELSVRAPADAPSDLVFDYIVWGLRIGFEEQSVVQERTEDAYIPSMDTHRDRYQLHPGLRSFNALERFKAMQASLGDSAPLDLSASMQLRDAIGEFDPAVHEVAGAMPPLPEFPPTMAEPRNEPHADPERADPTVVAVVGGAPSVPLADVASSDEGASFRPDRATTGEESETQADYPFPLLPVRGPVTPGDLLSADATGGVTMATYEGDPAVLGVAAGEPIETEGETLVPVAAFGIIDLKVDADLGSVRPGDLLVASSTAGHAMRAYAEIPGTVIGKALEPLDSGRAAVRVLVMPR